MKVKVKKLNPDARELEYAHKGDSGVDLYAAEEMVIKKGERRLVPTGLSIAMEEGFEAQVRPKSGLALREGITVLNTPGTIDSCYRGEVGVIVINLSEKDFEVKKGKKIAQMVFSKVEKAEIEYAEELDETTRNDGGFGSTGR